MLEKIKNNQILPQIISIALVIFFSVILVNAIDLKKINEYATLLLESDITLGIPIYVLGNAILYLVLIPSTVLGAASGVIFGLTNGIIIYSISCFSASVLIFFTARLLLKEKIQQFIQKKKNLVKAQSLVESEGLRFLFLIRFLPVHATIINALFALSVIKPTKFFISCLFLVPEWILHVYIGYVASITTQSAIEGGLAIEDYYRIISLVIAIVAIVYLGWLAQRIFRKSKTQTEHKTLAILNRKK